MRYLVEETTSIKRGMAIDDMRDLAPIKDAQGGHVAVEVEHRPRPRRHNIAQGSFASCRLLGPAIAVLVTPARRAALSHHTRLVEVLALIISVCLVAGCPSRSRTQIPSGSGYGYAIAYTPLTPSPNFVEVRTSADGITWSVPSRPFESAAIPCGIGAIPDRYVLAWFDSNHMLNTAISINGNAWAFHATHGQFSVDINSRPAVEYNFNTKSWLVAFTTTNGKIVVVPVDAPDGRKVIITGVTASSPPGLVWLIDHLVLLYKDANNRIVSLNSADGTSWPAGPGTPITSGGQEVLADDVPYVNRSLIGLWLGVKRLSSTGTLSTGNIRIYSYNVGNWELLTILNRTDPLSRGPALTGVNGALVVADTGVAAGTVMWNNERQIGSLDTRTQYDVSLAYGPRSTNTASLPDLICGPCDRCVDVLGGSLAPDYYRACTDRSGNKLTFRCKLCDPCIGSSRFCRPTQISDAPGYSEAPGPEPCNLCPPP